MGKRKRKEKEQTHHFLSSRFLCIFVKEKPYQQMYLRFVIKQDWKEWGFWSIKQTAQPSWWGGGPLIIQACIFPTCGWRLQAALKEQVRMQNDPRHHWFFCLAQKMPHLSVFLFLPSFIYYWMNIQYYWILCVVHSVLNKVICDWTCQGIKYSLIHFHS